MKKILLLLMAIMCLFAATGYAMVLSGNDMRGTLSKYKGHWYDENGQYAYTIDSDAFTIAFGGKPYGAANILGKVNKILEIDSHPKDWGIGQFVFKLKDENGAIRMMNVYVDVHGGEKGTFFMGLDNGQFLKYQDTKEVRYSESIGGVYLGMLKSQAERIYGAPTSQKSSGWVIDAMYGREGCRVIYYGSRVSQIILFKGGTRRFDKSGLNANNSLADFKRFYSDAKISSMTEGLVISNYGEQILVEGDKIIFGRL